MSELDELIAKVCDDAEDGFVVPVAAAKLYAEVSEKQPALLDAWLHDHAVTFIAIRIGARLRSVRAMNRARKGAHEFANASDAHDQGDDEPLKSEWLDSLFPVTPGGANRRMRDMVKADLTFVADHYETIEKGNAFEKAWFRVLARKVGAKRVGDVFSEDQLRQLRSELAARS